MSNKEYDLEDVVMRLDAIVYFLSEQCREHGEISKPEIFAKLKELGLKDSEIAKIFGSTRGSISGFIAKFNAEKRKKAVKK